MTPIRVGAVSYLNARPLVYGLDRQTERFSLRFDVPSKCASLLHEGAIDVGLIPSIEYWNRPDYRVVPDVAVTSMGPVASVALFSSRPTTALRSIAIDNSSRAAVALLRVLCAQWFDIEPKFVTLPPDLASMLKRCDAALVIGDTALLTEYESEGLDKVDLGEEWTAMTSLPFVWALWAGRANALGADDVKALQAARDAGVSALDVIANDYYPNDEDKAERARDYLHANVRYELDEQARNGLCKFRDGASDLRLVRHRDAIKFY